MSAPEKNPLFARGSTAPIPPGIEETAAAWVAQRDAGFSPQDAAELQAWLAEDPRHATAFVECEQAWTALNRPLEEGRGRALLHQINGLERHAERSRLSLHRAWAAVGLATAVALGLALWMSKPGSPASLPSAVTATLRPDYRELADGSMIELNAGAEIAVDFTPERRGVRLLHGEALFSVARDATRPFVVTADTVEVRAVGTSFAVRRASGEIAVLVTEGQVAVERVPPPARTVENSVESTGPTALSAGNPSGPVLLSAGGKVTLSTEAASTAIPAPEPVSVQDMAVALAWRYQRVEFTSTPLSEAVRYFNRDNRLQLVLADAATADLRITGVFWTDNPESFARLLAFSLGVELARESEDRIVLRK